MRTAIRGRKSGKPTAAVSQPKKRRHMAGMFIAKEYKVVALRERTLPPDLQVCEEPRLAAEYWRHTIAKNPYLNSDCECLAVLMLDTRRRIKGHQLITIGTMDTLLVHAREVFRGAIVANAAAIILMHNHPSGDPSPSAGDIKVTSDLIRGGELLKIQVVDHVIMGLPGEHCSRGFFSFLECYRFDGAVGLRPNRSKREESSILRRARRIAKEFRSSQRAPVRLAA